MTTILMGSRCPESGCGQVYYQSVYCARCAAQGKMIALVPIGTPVSAATAQTIDPEEEARARSAYQRQLQEEPAAAEEAAKVLFAHAFDLAGTVRKR